jgi:hypothetical protein
VGAWSTIFSILVVVAMERLAWRIALFLPPGGRAWDGPLGVNADVWSGLRDGRSQFGGSPGQRVIGMRVRALFLTYLKNPIRSELGLRMGAINGSLPRGTGNQSPAEAS